MTSRAALLGSLVALGACLAAPACDRRDARATAAAAASAAPVGGATCAACGMVVREQPPPHGQVVFHDGTRAFDCSLADLAQTLSEPSPHGAPERIFVEALPSEVAPTAIGLETPVTWIDATTASYVLGVPRKGVMGQPVLVYASRSDADRIARAYGGRVVAWTALRAELLGSAP
jgi:copper chaperone NosL